MKLLIMQSSPASCHFLPLRSNLRSSFIVRDQVLHPYKGKPAAISVGIKHPVREADHSPPG